MFEGKYYDSNFTEINGTIVDKDVAGIAIEYLTDIMELNIIYLFINHMKNILLVTKYYEWKK